jgi:hypothetical protein
MDYQCELWKLPCQVQILALQLTSYVPLAMLISNLCILVSSSVKWGYL